MTSVPSANQSMESGVSSLQRSGLNISVGDTKSIVLALQALQGKIRALEQDRNYHQDQYEQALRAHEAYKLDAEAQIERERAGYRAREQELSEALRRALDEKRQLEATLSGSGEDLSHFRAELEAMIAAEKALAEEREEKLQREVGQLRRDISNEKAKHAALVLTLNKLRAERAATNEVNDKLRESIQRLLAQGSERRVPVSGRRPSNVANSPPMSGPRRTGRAAAPRSATQRAPPKRTVATTSPHTCQRMAISPRHHSFADPTCNSLLRDVRNVNGEIPCCAPCSANQTMIAEEKSGGSFSRSQSGRSALTRSASENKRRITDSSSVVTPRPVAAHGAMSAVEAQLREELNDLQLQYDSTVARSTTEEVPQDILQTALNRLSSLIDQKKHQLRLVRDARREVETAGSSSAVGGATSTGEDIATTKSVQRTMLMNELRSMLAAASSKA